MILKKKEGSKVFRIHPSSLGDMKYTSSSKAYFQTLSRRKLRKH